MHGRRKDCSMLGRFRVLIDKLSMSALSCYRHLTDESHLSD
jgi:hypothetical protein